MPAAASSGSGSAPSDFRLWRSILRRWPNAAAVTRSSSARSQASGSARGTSSTTDEVTFGGGTKADGCDVEQDLRLACASRPAPTAGRSCLLPGGATMRSATSRWNISTSRSNHGGQGSVVSHDTSSGVAML